MINSSFRYIARTLSPVCTECRNFLIEPVSRRAELQDDNALTHRLIIAKDRGGLIYPSKILTKILTIAERYIRMISLTPGSDRSVNTLYYRVVKALGPPPLAFQQHAMDTQHACGNHYYSIIRATLKKYNTLRQFYIAEKANLALHPNKKRAKRNKETIFRGEWVMWWLIINRYDTLITPNYFSIYSFTAVMQNISVYFIPSGSIFQIFVPPFSKILFYFLMPQALFFKFKCYF